MLFEHEGIYINHFSSLLENLSMRVDFMNVGNLKETSTSRLKDVRGDNGGAYHRGQYVASANKTLQLLTPWRLVPRMVLSIFVAECFVMFLLAVLPPLSVTIEAIVDSSVLLILLSPTFYFFHYRPLFQHHQERKKVLDQLSLSEERLALTIDAVNDGLCDWNVQSGRAYFSPRAQTMLGYNPGDFSDDIDCWRHLIHPDDSTAVAEKLEEHLAGVTSHYETEHRLRKKNGEYAWILTRGKVVARDKDGRALRMVGTHTDITERKTTETALRKSEEEIHTLSQRLISSSEEEKKHLAQDLHDEFGQVLTAFQIGVEMLRSHSYRDEDDFQFHCARLLKMVETLEVDLRHICDQLRPIMLEDVGLIETVRWHIKEFLLLDDSLQVNFHVHGDEQPLSRDIEIACYRILQESLNNVVKHSNASQVEVKIEFRPDMVILSIEDNGHGFSESTIRAGKRRVSGFGLLGLRERTAAVGGHLEIESNIGQGTKIIMVVPLSEVKHEGD